MKTHDFTRPRSPISRVLILAMAALFLRSAAAQSTSASIPFSEIGANATADYKGDAISVTATPDGALLRCAFQKLEGRATREGLWITSTEDEGRFCVRPSEIGRDGIAPHSLAPRGIVSVADQVVTFVRPQVVEQYSVSMDGVRQDFVVAQRPAGAGRLLVRLEVAGARVEGAAYGAKLTLHGSGRELAYSRLRVTDATGRELSAVMQAASDSSLTVSVEDSAAAYPVRIDPTFSDADWVSMNSGGTGANNCVWTTAVDGGGNLYIGGEFTFVGSTAANRIAKWNGSAWSALGSGVNLDVTALAVSGTDLYATGNFTTAGGVAANYIAKWNGSAWSALGAGLNLSGGSLAVSGTDLYVGGKFSSAGGLSAKGVAKWNGSTWSALGAGLNIVGTVTEVYALKMMGTDLYAGGNFTTAGGAPANRVAKWNGAAWSPLGSGVGGAGDVVTALASIGTDLYASGIFTTAGGIPANNVAKWNGSAWSALGTGTSGGAVRALAVIGTELYVGGSIFSAGGVSVSNVAKWNGSSWSALGLGVNYGVGGDSVYTLAVSGSTLFAGGVFTMTGGVTVNRVAQWNGSSWSPIGPAAGIDGSVLAVALMGTDLYAGGSFTTAGGATANRIAKWNGSVWSPLGSGMNGNVRALAVMGTNLFAGGDFTTAGGATANRVARWNGSSWSALTTSDLNSTVHALAVIGTDLFAGGDFTTAGGAPANGIAKWSTTGTAWSALGPGLDSFGVARAFAVGGSNLYVGGVFSTIGGTTVNNIARWNGTSWAALGVGVNGAVHALAVSGSDVYVGGFFFQAGGVPANRIAQWTGTTWSALGSGLTNEIYALAVRGTELFAGGQFTIAGGVAASRVARWNGSAWSPLGSGMDGAVRALMLDSANHLFVAGDFTLAGTTVSPFIAQANIPTPDIKVEQPVSTVIGDGGNVAFAPYFSGASSLVFTIRNPGNDDLTGLTITKDGANAADFTVTVNPAAPVLPGGNTTFTIQFTPAASGAKSAAIHIANSAAAVGKNPYDINLSGQAYLLSLDTDSDGLNDGSEFQMSTLGFNWQVGQTALVNTLFNNLSGAQSNLNAAGYYSATQVQALNAPAPLIQRHPTTGVFTLTLGVEKSTNLSTFTPFPMTAPQCVINGAGKLEFQFTVPDNTAFFKLQAQ